MRLVEALGAIRLRSDVERKRLLGEQSAEQQAQLHTGIYSPQASTNVYQHLHQLAVAALKAGFPVVIDATYLKQSHRDSAAQAAEACGVPFLILDCQAPANVISQWLAQRQTAGQDPSDATEAVIQAQHASREALSDAELLLSTRVDTHDAVSLDSLIERIRLYLPGL